jgi:hypothetical protein
VRTRRRDAREDCTPKIDNGEGNEGSHEEGKPGSESTEGEQQPDLKVSVWILVVVQVRVRAGGSAVVVVRVRVRVREGGSAEKEK